MILRRTSGLLLGQAVVGIGMAMALRARASGAAARRQIARDLHDGAQQRLVALALRLACAGRRLDGGADPELETLLVSAAQELGTAVREIRELVAEGPPAALRGGGLPAALAELAARAPLPVVVDARVRCLAPAVERAAYFVASEALANVLKHARASRVTIGARHRDTSLVVEVTDDGVGGVTGVRALRDRVASCGGRLCVTSPAGGGTRVLAELPCAS
jgi:signal transduction histidine kinase